MYHVHFILLADLAVNCQFYMSLVVWNPARDRRDGIFYQVSVFHWDSDFNIQLWQFLTWQGHFSLQAISYTSHICCVDIVIFLKESDTESDLGALAIADE